jgi:hypothetical protein
MTRTIIVPLLGLNTTEVVVFVMKWLDRGVLLGPYPNYGEF